MSSLLFPQKTIGVVGKHFELTIKKSDDSSNDIELVEFPEELEYISTNEDTEGIIIEFNAKKAFYDYKVIKIKYKAKRTPHKLLGESESDEIEEKIFNVLTRVFKEKEVLLCLILQSNLHIGWEPDWEKQFLADGSGWKLRKKFGKEGVNAFGHSFKHVQTIEKIYHKRDVPITWLIDPFVAGENAQKFIDWHYSYGDDYGLLPTSYFYYNELNFNFKKTKEETFKTLRSAKNRLERVFLNNNYPAYSNFCGIDQWVGSIGTNWVYAANKIGYEGIWGMGWDHISCDTSMYHRGAPWSAYKPSIKHNYRMPIQEGESSKLWAYQWTHRDLTNSLHYSGPKKYGSTRFSTDPDDVRSNKITKQLNPHYFTAMLNEFKKNIDHPMNRAMEFIVHQEDHDSVHADSNKYLDEFLDAIFEKNEAGDIVIATLDEISQYFNLIYGPEETTKYLLDYGDPIKIHDQIRPGGSKAPKDWPTGPGSSYPTTLCYYGTDCMWLGYYPNRVPMQYFDYRKHHSVKETGSYPFSKIPKLSFISENFSSNGDEIEYTAEIKSNGESEYVPLYFWYEDLPGDIKSVLTEMNDKYIDIENADFVTKEAFVKNVDLKKGMNTIKLKFIKI